MKKEINGFFLIFLILSTSITAYSIILVYQNEYNGNGIKSIEQYPIPSSTVPFKVGYASNPYTLDPVDTWDVSSHNVQYQVVEGLVEYDYSTHPSYPIKPVLAESWVWDSDTQITFTLRQGVQFHDGSLMTAEDVKWNFERVQYFINATGTLVANATSWLAFPRSLFFHYDGTPIFDSFIADDNIDPYNFKIILSKPFGALLDLLCFGATDILSPESTPRYRYLDLATDDLVGTGPFEYDSFEFNVEILFHAYSNYWRGEAQIKEMIWTIIVDNTIRMAWGLAGLFDYIDGVTKTDIDTFRADPDFHVEDVGEDLCYFYLEIYSGPRDTGGTMIVPGDHQYQKNPAYLRRALALAINYTYIYKEIQAGYAVEGTTAVPRAMPGHNASVVQASDSSFTWEANIVKARQLLQANAADIEARGGMTAVAINALDPNTDVDWIGQNILGRNLEINRHFGSTTNMRVNELLFDNYDLLGIHMTETFRDWGWYLDVGQFTPWEMDIAYIGWCPDYLNPFNMIDPLFNLDSPSCFSRINDTSSGGLTELMDAAAIETDYPTQLDYYMKIQSLIYDVNRPLNPASHCHISGWVYLVQQVHKAELENFAYNVMQILDLYSLKWAPDDFYLDSDADTPDPDGNFNLIWTSSQGADNYSVFTSNSYITVIDGSLTLIADQNAISPFSITGLSDGTYYYIVAAYNEHGYTLSNCISVTVVGGVPEQFTLLSSADTPDPDGNFNLIWTSSQGADNYSVFTSNSYITELDYSQTLLSFQNATSPYSITGLSDGTYYYIVAAYNEYGYTLSNCISVTVLIEEGDGSAAIPGYNGFLLMAILGLVSSILVFRHFKKKNLKS